MDEKREKASGNLEAEIKVYWLEDFYMNRSR